MYDVEAEGNFGTAVAGVALRHGRWYYECCVDRCSLGGGPHPPSPTAWARSLAMQCDRRPAPYQTRGHGRSVLVSSS